MKRIWAAIFLALLIGGGFALWWFLRDTPEKALRDGFAALLGLKTAKSLNLEVSWTDPASRTTTGFGFSGQVDLKSWTRPRALGVLRVGASSAGGQNQTGDIVIESDSLALRPRSVSPELRRYAQSLSNDPSDETFLVVGRDAFLNEKGFPKAIANGENEALKRDAVFVIPALVPVSGLVRGMDEGRQTVKSTFRVDKKSIEPVLLTLVRSWMGDNPTPEEYGWAATAAASLASGRFELTLDAATRQPLFLRGEFDQLDETGKGIRKIAFSLGLSGHGQKVNIGIPEKSKDVTSAAVLKAQQRATLPQAKLRTLPGGATGTNFGAKNTVSTSTGKMINEKETDLFEIYYEEMLRKKNQQY